MAAYYQPAPVGEFKHGLFDCFHNVGDCCFAWLCPPCFAYDASQATGEGTCYSCFQCWFYPWFLCCLRSNVRSKQNINGSCFSDLVVTCCCPCCASLQIKHEFKD